MGWPARMFATAHSPALAGRRHRPKCWAGGAASPARLVERTIAPALQPSCDCALSDSSKLRRAQGHRCILQSSALVLLRGDLEMAAVFAARRFALGADRSGRADRASPSSKGRLWNVRGVVRPVDRHIGKSRHNSGRRGERLPLDARRCVGVRRELKDFACRSRNLSRSTGGGVDDLWVACGRWNIHRRDRFAVQRFI